MTVFDQKDFQLQIFYKICHHKSWSGSGTDPYLATDWIWIQQNIRIRVNTDTKHCPRDFIVRSAYCEIHPVTGLLLTYGSSFSPECVVPYEKTQQSLHFRSNLIQRIPDRKKNRTQIEMAFRSQTINAKGIRFQFFMVQEWLQQIPSVPWHLPD